MKQMNGTITLSFVEEDNKQRVIFRVVPLCTREGATFHDAMEQFPDEASLRVVPDKREQSTFKERMRGMGHLCAIELAASDGKELGKIRPNRNYDPAQGERNQYAIYSDVIMEFAPDAIFEVIEWNNGSPVASQGTAMTPQVLLLSDKVLYGPVASEEVAQADISSLKPFGNDHFLLHTVEMPDHQGHTLYWNPEAIINWRQKRSSLRRKSDRSEKAENADNIEAQEPEKVEKGESKHAPTIDQQVAKPVEAALPTVEKALVVQLQAAEKENKSIETALPIGQKLEILDVNASFEQHISRLDQPVSQSANRLTAEPASAPKAFEEPMTGRFSGTPLVRDAAHTARPVSRPEPLHHVVEQQMRISRDEREGLEVYGGPLAIVDNPVENLMMAIEAAWQDTETRRQAILALLDNEGFMQAMLEERRRQGTAFQPVAAAYAQLEDIEAERLSLLMQLDTAQNAQKKYQDQALASLSQKRREEIERLSREKAALEKETAAMEEALRALSQQSQEELRSVLGQHLTACDGIAQQHIVLSPVMGVHREARELSETLGASLRNAGFAMEPDDAMSLLISWSMCPCLCIQGDQLADAQLFAEAMIRALGLESVSAAVGPNTRVEIASLLTEDAHRTPTITLQELGSDRLLAYGHKTLYLADAYQCMDHAFLASCCVISVPLWNSQLRSENDIEKAQPAALSSFFAVCKDSQPLREDGDRWMLGLRQENGILAAIMAEASLGHIRQFVEIASRKLRGGFLGAADLAVCQWIVPQLKQRQVEAEQVAELFGNLPRSMETMGLQ